jgi:hypothetical protein
MIIEVIGKFQTQKYKFELCAPISEDLVARDGH